MDSHITNQTFAYAEDRLSPAERARFEAHLAVCETCRAEAADITHLVDTLAAVPRAFDGLRDPRQSQRDWPALWARVMQPAARGAGVVRAHGRYAWGMAAVTGLLVVAGLLLSPYQNSVLAAAGPGVAAIQTPAAPSTALTIEPAGETAAAVFDTTATHSFGQTPAPIPNP